MQEITAFPEFSHLLQSSQWGHGEDYFNEKKTSDVILEDSFLVFTSARKRIPKTTTFVLERDGGGSIEATAEQIAHMFVYRNTPLATYVRLHPGIKKLSTVFRSAVANAIKNPSTVQSTVGGGGLKEDLGAVASAVQFDGVEDGQVKKKIQQVMADVLKAEVKHFERNDALLAGRSFQEVINIDSRSKEVEEQTGKRLKKQKRARPLGMPIIMVPPNESAVLNMYNIQLFLEKGEFKSTEEIKAENPDVNKPDYIIVTHKHPTAGDIRFKVMDSTLTFDDLQWNSVVATFVSGATWQFKEWKWADLSTLFSHIRGVYVYFDNVKLPEHVKSWNVGVFPIKRQIRSKDLSQSFAIWEAVFRHMSLKHPTLLQSIMDEADARIKAEREARNRGAEDALEADIDKELHEVPIDMRATDEFEDSQ